jgi:hypothetical protein
VIGDQQYAAAILLAQSAVEMATAEAFADLVARKIVDPPEPVLDLLPDLSFMDKRTRKFWEHLTGRKITEPNQVWQSYKEHVERRNRVAHGREWGDGNGGQDARDSVAAARAFIERLGEELDRPWELPDSPW